MPSRLGTPDEPIGARLRIPWRGAIRAIPIRMAVFRLRPPRSACSWAPRRARTRRPSPGLLRNCGSRWRRATSSTSPTQTGARDARASSIFRRRPSSSTRGGAIDRSRNETSSDPQADAGLALDGRADRRRARRRVRRGRRAVLGRVPLPFHVVCRTRHLVAPHGCRRWYRHRCAHPGSKSRLRRSRAAILAGIRHAGRRSGQGGSGRRDPAVSLSDRLSAISGWMRARYSVFSATSGSTRRARRAGR
jgi:hypothetical protein